MFGGAVGLWNGLVVIRLKVNALIATIASMMVLQGGVFLYTREAVQNHHHLAAFAALSTGYLGPLPGPEVIAAATFLLAWLILSFGKLGRYLIAVGANPRAARLAGISTDQVKVGLIVLSGMLAGLAGVILSSLLNAGQPTAGRGFELTVIASVLLGGTSLTGGSGSLLGTLLGVLIIKVIDNAIIILRLNQGWQIIVPGVVLIIAAWLDRIQREHKA